MPLVCGKALLLICLLSVRHVRVRTRSARTAWIDQSVPKYMARLSPEDVKRVRRFELTRLSRRGRGGTAAFHLWGYGVVVLKTRVWRVSVDCSGLIQVASDDLDPALQVVAQVLHAHLDLAVAGGLEQLPMIVLRQFSQTHGREVET